jgi:glycosyltransferase involved in cell wall biosynthesis
MPTSFNPLVLIPSYNPGPKGPETVLAVLQVFSPVLVISDGSNDGTAETLDHLAETHPGLTHLKLPRNAGKGSAIFEGLRYALDQDYSHVVTLDADGQHPASYIPEFVAAAKANPEAMILGLPVFGEEAPALRVKGRRISNWWANLETLWTGIGDSLFGFRCYPVGPLHAIMKKTRLMRRFDFDPEAVVRLRWIGIRAVNLPTPVRYLSPEEGGVSHFRYGRDNALLTFMHIRLFFGFILRLPMLLLGKITGQG